MHGKFTRKNVPVSIEPTKNCKWLGLIDLKILFQIFIPKLIVTWISQIRDLD